MVVFLLLLSPVLVELVDFNSCVALLKQVERLCAREAKNKHTLTTLFKEKARKNRPLILTL